MTQVILIVVLLAGLGLWAFHFARAQRPAAPVTTSAPATKPLTRADLAAKLKALAVNPPPAKLSPGAMCYEMAAPPDRFEYVCPKCGEKTLYPTGTPTYGAVATLDHCRRLVQELRRSGLDVELDEQMLCRRCQPDAKSPGVNLILRFEGEPNPQTVPRIKPSDVQFAPRTGDRQGRAHRRVRQRDGAERPPAPVARTAGSEAMIYTAPPGNRAGTRR